MKDDPPAPAPARLCGDASLSIGQCATLACILEATAPKPGNVHRGADFEDLTYPQLLTSGVMIAPIMETAYQRPLGETILAAVRATKAAVATNSNLGILLLLGPLASVPAHIPLRAGVGSLLGSLSADDARLTYSAILLAKPGGLGRSNRDDLFAPPPEDLIAAMRTAQDRDQIARQYSTNFADIFDQVVPALQRYCESLPLDEAIVEAFLSILSQSADSLIARKCGREIAQRSSDWAAEILATTTPQTDERLRAIAEFDFWLRSDGHRRNPGTTADLIAAGLFVLLRDGLLRPPFDRCPAIEPPANGAGGSHKPAG